MNNQKPPVYSPDTYGRDPEPYDHLTKEVNRLRYDLEKEKDKRHQTNDILLVGGMAVAMGLCCSVL